LTTVPVPTAAEARVDRSWLRRGPRLSSSELALVTVTHDSARELEALLGSVRRHLPEAQVVVVDCASADGSAEVAREWATRGHLDVCIRVLGENLGFGRGSNRGVAEVDRGVTALVNPDVELVDDSLLAVGWEAARGDAPERLLAPLVLSSDGSRQDTVHPSPGSAAELVFSLVPPAAIPGRLGVALAPWRSRRPRRVGWAVACALVARTSTLRRLGPFDERIFMYGEDLELGLRAGAAGIETWFWPGARVLHHQAHSSARAFGGEPFERHAHGRHDAIRRCRGPRAAAVDDATQAVTFASRLALKNVLGRSAERERRQLQALRSARRRKGDAVD
jgi:N-acetylglucosaminyl-diphospho-decaprenol L-rhamnosyltransferase